MFLTRQLAARWGAFEARLARWLTPERCERYCLALAVIFPCGVLFSQLLGPGNTDLSRTIIGADFSAFFIAGRMVLQGDAAMLYDFAAQKRVYDGLIAPVVSQGFAPFVSPPFFALAMAPLALLPYELALTLWWLLSLATLAVVARWLGRALPVRRGFARTLALGVMFFPTQVAFAYGQASLFVLGLFTAWFLWARAGKDVLSGLALGLLLFKPQLMLGPLIVLVVQRRWRALAGVAAGAAAWCALGFSFLGQSMRDYLLLAPSLFDFLQRGDYRTWGIVSLFGMGVLLLRDVSAQASLAFGHALTLAGGVAILAIWRRARWEPASRAWDLRLAGTIGLSLVVSPQLFFYDTMTLLLPLAMALSYFPGNGATLLDGGPLLARTGLLVTSLFVGPYLTSTVVDALRAQGLPALVPQIATFTIVLFSATLVQYCDARQA